MNCSRNVWLDTSMTEAVSPWGIHCVEECNYMMYTDVDTVLDSQHCVSNDYIVF